MIVARRAWPLVVLALAGAVIGSACGDDGAGTVPGVSTTSSAAAVTDAAEPASSRAASEPASTQVASEPATDSVEGVPAKLVAPGAAVVEVASGLEFAEGPLWLSDDHLIVSDVDGDAVLAFDADGGRRGVRNPSNVANGHALDTKGRVVEAQTGDEERLGGIARIAADGSATVLVDHFKGKRFNAPNDLIVKRDGTIWFTDPDYGGIASSEIGFNGVYRLDPKTGDVTLLTDALAEPNGIAFSPDEKTLYVSDTGNGLFAFSVAADGTLGPEQPLGDGCDGIGVDEQGNIWATTCGLFVVVSDPTGVELGAISFPGNATNLAWGGADGKTLFVTTQEGGVYSLALTVRETD